MKKLLLCAMTFVLGMSAMNAQVVDPGTYEPVDGYELRNRWILSRATSNDPSDALGEARGMAVLGDEILFCKREGDPAVSSIDIYDIATGEFKRNVQLASNVFEGAGLPCNDIHVDGAGNVLVGNLTTSMAKSPFQVWKINLEDGSGTLVLDCTMSHLVIEPGEGEDDITPVIRIDAFGVYGDVDNNGYIMAGIAGDVVMIGDQVYRWDIEGGKIENPAEPVEIPIMEYFPATATTNGTAPRVVPVDEDYFYLDGFNSAASLYNMKGILVEGFGDESGDEIPESFSLNGVQEFAINSEDFLVYAWSNNEGDKRGNPNTSWALCKFGANQSFEGMQRYYIFPANGLGEASNAVRTAVPEVNVYSDKVAEIVVYSYKSGFAGYLFGKTEDIDAYLDGTLNIANNQVSILRISSAANGIELSEIADVEVYDFAGQKVAAKTNITSLTLSKGNYIVKAVNSEGTVVSKVIIK